MTAYEEIIPTDTTGADAHSGTPSAYVIDALDRAQRAFTASVDPDTPKGRQKDAIWSYIHHVTAALWCEAFTQVLPASAALVVEWLEGALEDDTAAQWVHEARTAIAEGRPIPLPYDETAWEVSQ